jgi:hypothetical protein
MPGKDKHGGGLEVKDEYKSSVGMPYAPFKMSWKNTFGSRSGQTQQAVASDGNNAQGGDEGGILDALRSALGLGGNTGGVGNTPPAVQDATANMQATRGLGAGGQQPSEETVPPHTHDEQGGVGVVGSGFKMNGWSGYQASPAKQTQAKDGSVSSHSKDQWMKKRKAACLAKPGHKFIDGSCYGPGEYEARQKKIADVKAGK